MGREALAQERGDPLSFLAIELAELLGIALSD